MNEFEGKRILVTGGTGSLGQTLVRRILSGEMGTPESVTVFSRDEAKQHYMRLDFLNREDRCLAVRQAGQVHLVNKRHIARVSEV